MNYLRGFLSIALLLTGITLSAGAVNAQVYGGRAQGVSASVTNSGTTTTVVADTGPLPVAGGDITISAPSASIAGVVSTGVLTASTSGALRSSQSVTVANDVDINIGGVRVRANRVTVNAGCICCPGAQTSICTASALLSGLSIFDQAGNSVAVTVTGQANQVIVLPDGVGTLTINEQVSTEGSISVNGMHIEASANGSSYSILVATAQSSLECAVTTPTPADVTISGRVLTASGSPVSRATVTLSDSAGGVRSVTTNSLGSFSFSGVQAGSSYILQASSRGYKFEPKVVSADADVTVDLVAN